MNYYVKYDTYCQDYRIYNGTTHRKLSLRASFALIKKFYLVLENEYRANEIRITDHDLLWSFYTFLFRIGLREDRASLPFDVSVTHISFSFTSSTSVSVQVFLSASSKSFNPLSPDIPF